MQFTDEMNWDETDFAVMGGMLFGACGAYELAARTTGNLAYRAAVAVAFVAAFILIWINLAVGIIGSEDNPANLMYGGVLAIAIVGALGVRFQPRGMARTLAATALAQALVGVIALTAGWGSTGANWPRVIVVLTGFFAALWLVSAWLFQKSAREETPTGATPSGRARKVLVQPPAQGHVPIRADQRHLPRRVRDAEGQHLRHHRPDLAGREVHHREDEAAGQFVEAVVPGDLSRGALQADLRPEIDDEPVGGLAGLRERLGRDDAADADVDLQELVEGRRRGSPVGRHP